MEDQTRPNIKFLKIEAFQKIMTDSQRNLVIFQKWFTYHKQRLSFKSQKSTNFKALLPSICISNVKEDKPQPFVNFIEEYRDCIQKANDSWLTSENAELQPNLQQLLAELNVLTQKISNSIQQIEKLGFLASHNIEEMFQKQIENEHSEAQSIVFYLKQKWEQRIQKANAFLEKSKDQVNEQVQKLKQNLQSLSSDVTEFRKAVLKFISALVYSYMQVSQKFMAGIHKTISLTQQTMTVLQQQLDRKFLNCTGFQYIKGLEILAEISGKKKKQQTFEYREIQKIFWNQGKELTYFKQERQILDKYANTRLEIHHLTKHYIKTVQQQKNNTSAINKNICSYLKQIKTRHNQLYQTYHKRKMGDVDSFRIKWPDGNYRWLWEQIEEQSMATYFLEQNNKIDSLKIEIKKYLQYCKSVLTKLNPTVNQQCNIYNPAFGRGCIEISEEKVIIYNSINCLIIPRSSISKAQIKRSENLKISVGNRLKVKLNKFKNQPALLSILKKLNQKLQPAKAARIYQDSLQTPTQIKVSQQILGLPSYKLYKTLYVDLSLKQLFKAIFDDSQPYCVDEKYSTFFGYLAEKFGDKDYSSQPWKSSKTQIEPGISIQTLTRSSKMTHFLPKIPFVPKTCECNENETLYWINSTHLIYIAEVNLVGSSMLENLVTKTVYEIKEINSQKVQIKLYGKAQMKKDGKFAGVIKSGAESDMVKILQEIADELEMTFEKYKEIHRNDQLSS